MIPFSPSMPDITKSDPIRVFRLGDHLALLLEKPKPIAEGAAAGMIDFVYALVVMTATKQPDLVCIVTSEKSGKELRKMAKETTEFDQSLHPFLCIFDQTGGHHNLGDSPDWENQDKFTTRALVIARERLGIQTLPVEVEVIEVKNSSSYFRADMNKPTTKDRLRSILIFSIAVTVAAMMFFPPYIGYDRFGRVWKVGYALIFDLPSNVSVNVTQLIVQWIGVLIIGGILSLLLKRE